jgi:hypothetical protein
MSKLVEHEYAEVDAKKLFILWPLRRYNECQQDQPLCT